MDASPHHLHPSSAPRRRFLVTGATGKTGSQTIPLLLDRGDAVRALVRCDDARAAALRALGAEVVVADLLAFDAVAAALADVDGAYFCYPLEHRLLEAAVVFAEAARVANVGAIVEMSQISARRDSASGAARQHWLAERMFDRCGVPVTHLRPTLFADWLLLAARGVADRDVYDLPFTENRHAPIAASDQAHVITAVLADPQPHAGKTYALYGPVEMTPEQIAAELSAVLGRTIRAESRPIATFAADIAQRTGSEHLAQHIGAIALDYRTGLFAGTNDVVARIGRAVPTTVAAFVREHATAFAPAPLAARR